jgi:hypothetical protein
MRINETNHTRRTVEDNVDVMPVPIIHSYSIAAKNIYGTPFDL